MGKEKGSKIYENDDVIYEWLRSATSPAQSVLTMPNDPPSNSTTCDQGGVSEIASIQNGKIYLFLYKGKGSKTIYHTPI